jgi:hypothetical protein
MPSITTTTGNVAALLGAVLPFAEKEDDVLPALRTVEIRAGGGEMTATATNRYVAGYARQGAEGELGRPVMLVYEDVELLLAALAAWHKDGSRGELLTLTVGDEPAEAVFGYAGRSWAVPEQTYASLELQLTPLFEDVPSGAAEWAGPIGMRGEVIVPVLAAAKVVAAEGGRSHDLMRWYLVGPQKPVRVEMADWFIALIMPSILNRYRQTSLMEVPNVRYGLRPVRTS